MSDVKIWRVYNNGSVKNETHVLWPHCDGAQKCIGYGGNVEAWSEHNKRERFGCAQIMQVGDDEPVILYEGYLNAERLKPIIEGLRNE